MTTNQPLITLVFNEDDQVFFGEYTANTNESPVLATINDEHDLDVLKVSKLFTDLVKEHTGKAIEPDVDFELANVDDFVEAIKRLNTSGQLVDVSSMFDTSIAFVPSSI